MKYTTNLLGTACYMNDTNPNCAHTPFNSFFGECKAEKR